jgi:hypothetical protein
MPMIDVYAPAGTFRGRAVKERIWVLLTEAPDGGWGLAGHAHTNGEIVAAGRAQLGKQ